MTRISRSHPRYSSLKLRAALADALRSGLVVPEGLIAQGRGEMFDYLLGERTIPSARAAERTAARWLRDADHPVLSVNGNVAALAASAVARLQRARPGLGVEVNLFHRTAGRAQAIATRLRRAGVTDVLGVRPDARIPGLPSDRSFVDARGIANADVCLIPLEDGDRAEALRRSGKTVVSIDLNPLSRTSAAADLPIVDELGRALGNLAADLERSRGGRPGPRRPFDAEGTRGAALREMARNLQRWASSGTGAAGRASPRRPRGTSRRTRRTP